MIVYDMLWETMRERNISQYKLIKEYHISTGQLDRLRKNDDVSTHTLDLLCQILHCQIADIVTFVESDLPEAALFHKDIPPAPAANSPKKASD